MRYALWALLLSLACAGVGTLIVEPAGVRGVWAAAGIAWLLQLVAFGMLVVNRSRANLFLASWAGGMLLRLGALAVVAYWVTRSPAWPAAVTLVTLAGILFLLLLLEPVFLRRGLRTT